MSFWNFLGGFAVFNAVCDMFSSKPKRTNAPTQQLYHGYDHEDYLTSAIGIEPAHPMQMPCKGR